MNDHFSSIREIRNILKAVAVVSGEMSVEQWDRIRGCVLRALLPFDEARVAVRTALRELGELGESSSS